MSAVIRSRGLPGGLDEDVDHPPAHLDHLGDRQLHVGRLALGAAVRLVDQDPGVGQRVALARRARGEQHRRGRRRLADADRRHVGIDVPHRVVDGEQPVHVAAGAVDVERDVGVGVLASRCSSWATTRLATLSSIGVPRKTMRLASRRE